MKTKSKYKLAKLKKPSRRLPDLKNALIFLSVLPESEEQRVLAFAKRSRTDFRDFIKKKSSLKFLPHFDFEIDYGEKNRQLIDDLTRS